MESTHEQLQGMNKRIEDLYQLTEQIGQRLADVLNTLQSNPVTTHDSPALMHGSESYSLNRYSRSAQLSEHKDVLADSGYSSLETLNERELSPDIQIRRLTAQLTAAYNRIAALEEQLLSRRTY